MDEAICTNCGATAAIDTVVGGICIKCQWLKEVNFKPATTTIQPISKPVVTASAPIGDSSKAAIDTLRIINNFVAVLGAMSALILLFIIPAKLIAVISMASIAFVVLIVWAVNRLFIGIAEDIKGIREQLGG